MKTFREVRKDVLDEISRAEQMGDDNKLTFGQIEELAAKEYAKIWVDEMARQLKVDSRWEPWLDRLKKEIDAQ